MKGEFYRMEYEAWDEGTDGLTLEREAAYLRLCHQMYRRRGAVPDNPATLARIWRCHPNKARKLLDDLLAAGKVTRSHEGLCNARVLEELDHRGVTSKGRAESGREGGLASGRARAKSAGLPPPSRVGVGAVAGMSRPIPPERPGDTAGTTLGRYGDISGKSLKSDGTGDAVASSPANQRRGEKRRETQHGVEASETSGRRSALDDRTLEAALREAAGLENDPSPNLYVVGPIHALVGEGYDLDKHILPVLRSLRAQGKTWKNWRYVVPAIRERNAVPPAKAGEEPAAPPSAEAERRGRLAQAKGFIRDRRWSDSWGPRRGEAGCVVADEIWQEAERAIAAEMAGWEERRRAGSNGAAIHD